MNVTGSYRQVILSLLVRAHHDAASIRTQVVKATAVAAEKFSASMDDVLLADARAEAQGMTLSSWLAVAAADRLRLAALRRLVDEYEAQHGAISGAELDALEHQGGRGAQPGPGESRAGRG